MAAPGVSGNNQSKFSWFFKYKIYHLPFWFAYHYMWWTLTIGSVSQVFDNIFHSPFAFKFLFAVIFQAIGVYFNLYFLIPRFLEKGKYFQYISLLLLTIGLTAAFLVMGYYATAAWSERTFEELFHMSPGNYVYIFKANALSSTVASMTLAMTVKLTKNWISARQKQQVLEKEKLETELKFLRSQFNPHFLFNTINSIFVLINKNPVVASESLAKFSDLLRYQLYECNEHEISIRQEIHYLRNFIELQKLRQDSDNLDLVVELEQNISTDLAIAPFVLIPFIENAFKHVSQKKDKRNRIAMNLRFEGRELQFMIENSISPQSLQTKEFIQYGGIGLKNVQRRLDLIYPGKHQLTITEDGDFFRVHLLLELNEQTVPRHVMAMEFD
ncbi:MAG: histidine kinase [Chitinophagaceae bacterium]